MATKKALPASKVSLKHNGTFSLEALNRTLRQNPAFLGNFVEKLYARATPLLTVMRNAGVQYQTTTVGSNRVKHNITRRPTTLDSKILKATWSGQLKYGQLFDVVLNETYWGPNMTFRLDGKNNMQLVTGGTGTANGALYKAYVVGPDSTRNVPANLLVPNKAIDPMLDVVGEGSSKGNGMNRRAITEEVAQVLSIIRADEQFTGSYMSEEIRMCSMEVENSKGVIDNEYFAFPIFSNRELGINDIVGEFLMYKEKLALFSRHNIRNMNYQLNSPFAREVAHFIGIIEYFENGNIRPYDPASPKSQFDAIHDTRKELYKKFQGMKVRLNILGGPEMMQVGQDYASQVESKAGITVVRNVDSSAISLTTGLQFDGVNDFMGEVRFMALPALGSPLSPSQQYSLNGGLPSNEEAFYGLGFVELIENGVANTPDGQPNMYMVSKKGTFWGKEVNRDLAIGISEGLTGRVSSSISNPASLSSFLDGNTIGLLSEFAPVLSVPSDTFFFRPF